MLSGFGRGVWQVRELKREKARTAEDHTQQLARAAAAGQGGSPASRQEAQAAAGQSRRLRQLEAERTTAVSRAQRLTEELESVGSALRDAEGALGSAREECAALKNLLAAAQERQDDAVAQARTRTPTLRLGLASTRQSRPLQTHS